MEDENNEFLNSSLITLSIHGSSSSDETTISNISEKNVDISTENIKKSVVIRRTPIHNVPEKIILCLDTCIDPNHTPFRLGTDLTLNPTNMCKRVIEFFVHNKHCMDDSHEFALVTLNKNNINWVQEFTNSPREIIRALNGINLDCEQETEYDITSLLDAVWQTVTLPKLEENILNSYSHVVRIILFYSRSYCVPVVKKSFSELFDNPFFIFDVIVTHEEQPEKDILQDIFDGLKLDKKGYAYNFYVGRNAGLLHSAVAKLLSHPLQRPVLSEVVSYAAPVFENED